MLSRKLRSMFGTVVGLAMVLSLVGGSVAQAAALSQTQINAIVSLLQSFGADAGTVANVTASLNGQPTTGGTTTTTSGSGYNFATDLTVGSKGADVTALQQVLVSGGYLTMPAGVAYGYFGSITKAAVIKYQLAKGIAPAAGYFGPKTRASMSGSSVTTTTTTTSTGTDLAVSLAATSPVAGAVINGQAAANLAEYTFTNKSSAPALVTNVTLMRGGVSADTTLNNVYLFSGATRLTESATVSSGKITFNAGAGLFTVPAGGSVTVAVKADILSTAAAGQTVNVSLTGVTSNVAVAAVYPISGSTMTVATASDLATVTLASTSVSTTLEAGSINQTIWGSSFTQAGRAVYLKSLAVKVIGSVPADSFQNLKLFVSGVQVATATGVDANGMITFDLTSNPYKIDSSRNLEIRADIVNGSTRTFSVSLQNVADIQVIDSNYNIGISVAGTLPTTNTITVSGGTLAISLDSTLGSSDVVLGSTGVSLAKYTVKAYGENMKTSYLKVAASQDLTNVTLYLNGSSISSSQNVSSTTATTFSLGSSMIINAGTTATLEIRGDLKNAAGTSIATSSTVIVTLQSYTNNTQGSYSSALTTYP
ncbi:MAG: peptidoglycan-binding domain-containing protein, partial [Candidatus Paceibacterota bacterium]